MKRGGRKDEPDDPRKPERDRRLAPAARLAREGRLYPAVILHGGDERDRQTGAAELARTLLCERERDERPCGECRHCRRIAPPMDGEDLFHPDFAWLARDLTTATSAEATRDLLRSAQLSPFEARGQVFVIADAASLSGGAADTLLKAIEEPGSKAPRNYFLLAPSRSDLPPTLRSRSLSIYLGSGPRPDADEVAEAAQKLREKVARASAGPAAAATLWRLAAADDLFLEEDDDEQEKGKEKKPDPRASAPWSFAASVALAAARSDGEPPLAADDRRRLLALAEALLEAMPMRLRGIGAERILEGLVARHLGSPAAAD